MKTIYLFLVLFFSIQLFATEPAQVLVEADVTQITQAGDVINYTVTVTNISDAILYEYSIAGSFATLSYQSGDANEDNLLDWNEVWVYTASYTITQENIDNNGLPSNNGFIYYEVVTSWFYNDEYTSHQFAVETAIIGEDNDGDGVINSTETANETDPNNGCDFNVADITQQPSNVWFNADCDEDGLTNEEEYYGYPDSDDDSIIDILDMDDDGDGIRTSLELGTNSDNDSLPDYLDTDSDNDTIPDNIEAQETDSYIAPSNIDTDQDGLDDAYVGLTFMVNTDGDSLPDFRDNNSDNDTFTDINEGTADIDNDGIPNYRDANEELASIEFIACGDANNQGSFAHSTMEISVLSGLDPNIYHASFYPTITDVINATNMLADPFISTTNEIYARVTNTSDEEVTYYVVTLTVQDTVEASNATLTECGENDTALFNLTTVISSITTEENVTVTFYVSNADASSNTNTLPTNYSSISNPQILYARVQSDITSCYTIATVTLAVETCTTCYPPSNLVMDAITDTTNTVYWEDINSSTPSEWEVEYGEIDFNQGNGTLVTATETYAVLDNLNEGTYYDVYIRSKCGESDFSEWTMLTFLQNNCTQPVGTNVNYNICSDTSLYVDLNGQTTLSDNTYMYVAIDNPNVSGESLSINTSELISDTLINTSTYVQDVVYTVTPTSSDGCLGDSFTVIVIVDPEPIGTSSTILIENNTTLSIYLEYYTTLYGNTFYWLAMDNPDVTGETLSGSTFNEIDDTLTNTSSTIQTVMYTITPMSAEGCMGYNFEISITINPGISGEDTPYLVETIPFQIYSQTLDNTFNLDDGFTSMIDLGFNFNFFGLDYPQVTIGTNSVISFDSSDANGYCAWQIADTNVLPSSSVIDNAILGAYQDYYDAAGGAQGYGLIGTAPFRKFVVFFDEVALFSCTSMNSTNQMILYETYNFIDVQIQDRNVCDSWNNGNAILGIQNIGGEFAYFPEDRNTGNWEAHDEGHRFKPAYDLFDYQYIICDDNLDGSAEFDITNLITELSGSTGNTYSVHLSLEDAENNTNLITSLYTNISNVQTIFVREVDNGTSEINFLRVLLAAIDCAADYDLDSIDTVDEDLNGNGNYGDDDTDNDGIPDFVDEDDDGDFILTNVEAVVTTTYSASSTSSYLDTDDDGIPNYLDDDDDGDGVLTKDEDYDGDGNPLNDDTNEDGIPDYLQSVVASITDKNIQSFSIYPNPATDFVTLELQDSIAMDVKLYNIQGQEVYHKEKVIKSLQIDISTLSNGVYFVTINNENKTSTKKFVKN